MVAKIAPISGEAHCGTVRSARSMRSRSLAIPNRADLRRRWPDVCAYRYSKRGSGWVARSVECRRSRRRSPDPRGTARGWPAASADIASRRRPGADAGRPPTATSTIAPCPGSTNVVPVNVTTYSSGIGFADELGEHRAIVGGRGERRARQRSPRRPARRRRRSERLQLVEGAATVGSGTTASRLRRYASVSGSAVATLARNSTRLQILQPTSVSGPARRP